MKYRILIAVIVFCSSGLLRAQSNFVPLSNQVEQPFQLMLNKVGNNVHTSVKPFMRHDFAEAALFNQYGSVDKPLFEGLDAGAFYDSLIHIGTNPAKKFNTTWLGRKLFSEHLLQVEEDDYKIYLDPAFELATGRDNEAGQTFYYNTRGLWVNGSIGKRFGFNATFYENLSKFPVYLDSAVRDSRVVPGQGRVKRLGDESFDYAFTTGSINFRLNRHFTFEFGQDRHFFGDGYRSLLLSDNAFHYPYFKIVTDVWKVRYVNLFTEMRSFDRQGNNDLFPFERKYASFHYLDINIGKRTSLGIFESVVWHGDSTGSRGFDLGYMNPFLFFRPVEFSIGSPDNVLLGLNAKFKINSRNTLYAQLMLDEFLLNNVKAGKGWWGNKQGLQAGFKSYDVAGVKNLYLQGEFNYVRPFTYQHRDELGSYSHYRAPLAHPLGANFWEAIGIARYSWKRWIFDARMSYAIAGYDSAGLNFGQNVLLTYNDRVQEEGNKVGQGIETKIFWATLNVSFLFNPQSRMSAFAEFSMRRFEQPTSSTGTLLVQAGIRTFLFNRYYDF